MKIPRLLKETILQKLLTSDKVIVVYGARQVGKTTLINQIIEEAGYKTLSVNADQIKYNDILSSRDLNKLKALVSGYDLLFIDEAQRIPEIGINLKILTDEIPELKIIVTGSFSLSLSGKMSEPLTGRKWTFTLFPVSSQEMNTIYNRFEINDRLEEWLVFGWYPEIICTVNHSEKRELLDEVGNSYLFKDVFELSNIKYPAKIRDLLKLLSFQIGSEVSLNELSKQLKLNRESVDNYINLLEQSFVIFRLSGFSRNLRKEVSKMDKFYFYDLGIRNMIIDNFKPLKDRNDIGNLWENFLIAERKKYLSNNRISVSTYFWRTYTGAEVDYIEERASKLFGYEFKFNIKKVSPQKTWLDTYQNATFDVINRDNYPDFIL